MKKLLAVIPLLVISSSNGFTADYSNHLGVGIYDLNVNDDNEMKGKFISYMREFDSTAAIKLNYFKANHKTIISGESSGFEVSLISLRRFDSRFSVSLGLGLFKESWKMPDLNQLAGLSYSVRRQLAESRA